MGNPTMFCIFLSKCWSHNFVFPVATNLTLFIRRGGSGILSNDAEIEKGKMENGQETQTNTNRTICFIAYSLDTSSRQPVQFVMTA